MEFMDILQAAALVVPVLTLVFYAGMTHQRIKNIESMVTGSQDAEAECRADRKKTEDGLHGRCTNLDGRVSRLEGRLNGHGR